MQATSRGPAGATADASGAIGAGLTWTGTSASGVRRTSTPQILAHSAAISVNFWASSGVDRDCALLMIRPGPSAPGDEVIQALFCSTKTELDPPGEHGVATIVTPLEDHQSGDRWPAPAAA